MKMTLPNSPGSRFAWLAVFAIGSALLHATPESGPGTSHEIAEFVAMDVGADSRLKDAKVEVEVAGGIAVLTGRVKSLDEAERAMARAMATQGVRAVLNQLEIAAFSGNGDELRGVVEAELKGDRSLDAERISVEVKDGAVILTGEVGTWDEQEIAREAVSRVPGVALIENRLEVLFDTVRSDAQMEAQINALIADDPLYDGLHLTATVKDGVASVKGEVGSRAEYDRLVRRLYVTGVFEVKAYGLSINRDLAMEAMGDKHYSPEETRELIGELLALDERVDGQGVGFSLEEGVVSLSGRAKSAGEKAAAEAIVRGVPGIRAVANGIVVDPGREIAANRKS